MRVLVSACLLGENCKYNGGNNRNQKILDFLEGKEVIPVCPEQFGGLPTPRVPSEIVNGIVTNKQGQVVDSEFRLGAEKALQIALENKVDLAILQSRSPSCGPTQIYDGSFSKKLVPGQGIFAQKIKEAGIKIMESDDFTQDS